MVSLHTACGATASDLAQTQYLLRFESLFHAGRGMAFPCDAQGHVDLDGMTDRARESYLYARAVIGREYAFPQVLSLAH
ncbi:hypothetical protein [Ideonella dechloratans]|uniref:hypothetical protein n=1 Tax=Ideonella dechloratans TaxID=36863 RepID=UPI0035AE8855